MTPQGPIDVYPTPEKKPKNPRNGTRNKRPSMIAHVYTTTIVPRHFYRHTQNVIVAQVCLSHKTEYNFSLFLNK
jgi:hypothetical protein